MIIGFFDTIDKAKRSDFHASTTFTHNHHSFSSNLIGKAVL